MPIVDIGGRFRSLRTDEDLFSILKSELDTLTPEERQVAEAILQDVLMGQGSSLHEEIYSDLYRVQPVPMETFLTDPYFLGAIGRTLFPKVKESLVEIFSGQYKQAFYGGGLGCVREDTLIDTIEGPRPISEISHSTQYLSLSSETLVYAQGTSAFPKARGMIYRVVHERDEFFAAGSHLCLCSDGKYRFVEDLYRDRDGISLRASVSLPHSSLESYLQAPTVRLLSIEKTQTDWYWDLHVPGTNNYSAHGVVHHNTGKSTAGCLAILRMIYEVSCLKDPHSAYGISKSDTISFPCISVTEDVAERNLLEKIRAFISDSPYFSKEFAPVKNTAGKGIMFQNRILIPPGASTEAAVLGTNSMGCLIDEGNFFGRRRYNSQDNNSNKSNIEIIYEGMKRRIESRFLNRGKLPGLMFIASSKRSVDSFTEKEIRKNTDRNDVYVAEFANWEVHPEGRYGKERFRVSVGSETTQSKILAKDEMDPEGALVIEVPMEFYDSFEQDLDQAIRDIAGISTVSITPFIGRREKIYEAIDSKRAHPFNQEVWDMSFPGRIDWSKLAKQLPDGSWRPLVNPEAPRHIHLDLSKTGDRTGFSVCHTAGYTTVQKMGSTDSELAPVVVVDFMLALQAPRAGEIIYAEIRKLIYEFSKHGFFIKLVSADQFQSVSTLQSLASQGYKTRVVSVEPAGGPYESLKLALYENRLKIYNYPPLIKELRELQKNWKTGKVDHPDTGSKDCADTLAANIFTLSQQAYGVTDAILTSDELLRDVEDASSWVLDDPNTIVIEPAKEDTSKPEWRKNAERAINEEKAQQQSWRSNFSLPFEMG